MNEGDLCAPASLCPGDHVIAAEAGDFSQGCEPCFLYKHQGWVHYGH